MFCAGLRPLTDTDYVLSNPPDEDSFAQSSHDNLQKAGYVKLFQSPDEDSFAPKTPACSACDSSWELVSVP